MTALAANRGMTVKDFKSLDFPAAVDEYYQGALICWDISLSRAVVGQAGTDLVVLGVAQDRKTISADGAMLTVTLLRPLRALWMANSATDAVDANDLLRVCFVEDDQTVRETNGTNTCSPAGIVWAVDTTKGVLVELDHKLIHLVGSAPV
jgi:hypothetical protein